MLSYPFPRPVKGGQLSRPFISTLDWSDVASWHNGQDFPPLETGRGTGGRNGTKSNHFFPLAGGEKAGSQEGQQATFAKLTWHLHGGMLYFATRIPQRPRKSKAGTEHGGHGLPLLLPGWRFGDSPIWRLDNFVTCVPGK